MKVLFYSTTGLTPQFFSFELSLINKEIAKGNEVYVVRCNNFLDSCCHNPTHNVIACAICEGRYRKFHSGLVEKKNTIYLKKTPSVQLQYEYTSYDDLVGLEYKNINIGRGIVSSMISLKREYELIYSEAIKEIVDTHVKMAQGVVDNFERIIHQYNPDKIIIYNGRHTQMHPVISMCELLNIDYETFEQGSSKEHYQLFDNCLPHSIAGRKRLMESMANTMGDSEIEKANQWYLDKRRGVNKDDKAYTKHQKAKLLPKGFDNALKNIVIFNSSEDEMKVIAEWQHNLYNHQNDAIDRIVSYFKSKNEYHIYLRMHPNLANVNNTQTKGLAGISADNFTIIEADDKVDTYTLLDYCDIVVTFGSTIGIEATYWGKPSILFGRSFYENTKAVYQPDSYEEFFELVERKFLKPIDKSNTLIYGYYSSSYGTLVENYKYISPSKGVYNGGLIKRVYPATIKLLLSYFHRIPHWNRMLKLIHGKRITLKNFLRIHAHFK